MAVVLTILLIVAIFASVGLMKRWERQAGYARSQWPIVEGTVTSSRSSSVDISEPCRTLNYFSVWFTYEVDGVRYSGMQDWPGGGACDERKYAAGTIITVHYDPDKPKTAVVDLMKVSFVWAAFVGALGVPATLTLGCILIWTWATRRKDLRCSVTTRTHCERWETDCEASKPPYPNQDNG